MKTFLWLVAAVVACLIVGSALAQQVPPGYHPLTAPAQVQADPGPETLIQLLPPKYAVWGIAGLFLFKWLFPQGFAKLPGQAPASKPAS